VLTESEIKALRNDLRQAHELVKNAFSTTRAAGVSNIARDLRHIGNSIEDAICDLGEMQAQLEKQAQETPDPSKPPASGGAP
jgi:hypothetical protein